MKNRNNRKQHMIKLMNELNIKNYTFIEPYEPNQNTKLLYESFINKTSNLPLTKISHSLTYLKLLSDSDEDRILILEDDIINTKSKDTIKRDLDYIIYNYPKDADMIYLEMCYEKCLFDVNVKDTFVKLTNPTCAAAIAYLDKIKRKNLVKNLLLNSMPDTKPIDNCFSFLIENKFINAYAYDLLFIQDNNFGSDLEGSIGYGQSIKPILPICETQDKNIIYVKNKDYIIKNLFIPTSFSQIKNNISPKLKNYSILYTIIFILIIIIFYKLLKKYFHK